MSRDLAERVAGLPRYFQSYSGMKQHDTGEWLDREAVLALLAESTPAAPDERCGAFSRLNGLRCGYPEDHAVHGGPDPSIEEAARHPFRATPAAPDEEGLDAALALALHHAMCPTSHHDRDVENARCFPMYRNIALSAGPAYRRALASQDKA